MLNTLPTFLKSPSTGTALGATEPANVATAGRSAATSGNGDFAALMQHQADQRLAEQRQAEQRSAAATGAPAESAPRPSASPPPSAPQSASKPAEAAAKDSAPAPQPGGSGRTEQAHSEAAAQPHEGSTDSTASAPSPSTGRAAGSGAPAAQALSVDANPADVDSNNKLPSALTAIQAALLAASPSATGLHPWSALTPQGTEAGQGPAPVTLPAVAMDTALPTTSTKTKKRELPAADLPDDAGHLAQPAATTPATDTSAVQPWLQAQALVASLATDRPTVPLANLAEAANDATPSTADLALAGQRQRAAQAGVASASPRAGRLRPETANATTSTAAANTLAAATASQAAARTSPADAATSAASATGDTDPLHAADAPALAASTSAATDTTAQAATTAMAQAALQAGAAQAASTNPGATAQPTGDATTVQASEATGPARRPLASARSASADTGHAASPAGPAAPARTGPAGGPVAAAAGEASGPGKTDAGPASARAQAANLTEDESATRAPGATSTEPSAAGTTTRGDTSGQDSTPRDHGGRPDAPRDITALPPAQGLAAPASAANGTHAGDTASRAVEALGAATSTAATAVGNTNLPQATGSIATPANPGQGAAATAEVRIPVPLDSPAFAPALGAQVSLLAKDGVQTARLQLNPAEMGPITVQIAIEGNGARVDFAAERAGTREAIEASLPALAGALQDAGLTLTGGGVFQQSPGHQPQQQPQGGQAPFSPTPATTLRGQDTSTPLAANAGLPAPRRGLVDLVA